MVKRTIRRRVRKNKTIRKVMRGCNRRRMKAGGATIQAHQYSGAPPAANQNIAALTQYAGQAHVNAQNTPPPIPLARQATMAGGARTRHHKRRLRYKKSMARKSRHA
jgi:hypothetical protein